MTSKKYNIWLIAFNNEKKIIIESQWKSSAIENNQSDNGGRKRRKAKMDGENIGEKPAESEEAMQPRAAG